MMLFLKRLLRDDLVEQKGVEVAIRQCYEELDEQGKRLDELKEKLDAVKMVAQEKSKAIRTISNPQLKAVRIDDEDTVPNPISRRHPSKG